LVATLFGAGESQVFAKKIEQRNTNIQFKIEGLAVYQEMHGRLHNGSRPRAVGRRNDMMNVPQGSRVPCDAGRTIAEHQLEVSLKSDARSS
jgi:hypothetical protein